MVSGHRDRSLTREEADQLRDMLRQGRVPTCPECGRPMDMTDVPPRTEVSYVRHRAVLQCGRCGIRGVVDRR